MKVWLFPIFAELVCGSFAAAQRPSTPRPGKLDIGNLQPPPRPSRTWHRGNATPVPGLPTSGPLLPSAPLLPGPLQINPLFTPRPETPEERRARFLAAEEAEFRAREELAKAEAMARFQAQQAEQEARKQAAKLEAEKQEAARQLEDIARRVRELGAGKPEKN